MKREEKIKKEYNNIITNNVKVEFKESGCEPWFKSNISYQQIGCQHGLMIDMAVKNLATNMDQSINMIINKHGKQA